MRRKIFLLLTLIACIFTPRSETHQVALKTNLLYDATLTVNLGAEVELAPKWTLDLSGNLNAWSLSHGRRWKHWLVQPEARYWFCEAMGGHFIGAHALGGKYNAGHIGFRHDFLGLNLTNLRDHRYQGWFAGLGVAYGYSWLLSRHWNIEAELGIGWIYTRYNRFECEGCGRKVGSAKKHYAGPTKAAVNLVYVF